MEPQSTTDLPSSPVVLPSDPSSTSGSAAAGPTRRPRLWTLVLAGAVALWANIVALFTALFVVTTVLGPRPAAPSRGPDLAGLEGAMGALLQTLPGLLVAGGASALALGGVALAASWLSPQRFAMRLALARPQLSAWGWVAAVTGGLAVSQGADAFLQLSGVGRGGALDFIVRVLEDARGPGLVAAVVTLGFGAGAAEELFFRGYVQTRLVARWGAWIGVGLTAAAFAFAHFDPQHSFFAFLFGAFVGFAALAARSTWPAIAVHVINNSLSVATVALAPGGSDAPASTHGAVLAACLVVVAWSVWQLRHERRRNAMPPPGTGPLDASARPLVGSGA